MVRLEAFAWLRTVGCVAPVPREPLHSDSASDTHGITSVEPNPLGSFVIQHLQRSAGQQDAVLRGSSWRSTWTHLDIDRLGAQEMVLDELVFPHFVQHALSALELGIEAPPVGQGGKVLVRRVAGRPPYQLSPSRSKYVAGMVSTYVWRRLRGSRSCRTR